MCLAILIIAAEYCAFSFSRFLLAVSLGSGAISKLGRRAAEQSHDGKAKRNEREDHEYDFKRQAHFIPQVFFLLSAQAREASSDCLVWAGLDN